ncbi:bifunctional diaminohydroxyphosphoribosylaminopyrimidine deaminase/5-amino-6-(5-phosphoribosylamino)uracil reductase RibD [Actinorugispora endophytica]|uniref:diaminohydroxyphosphoribosylaminopyrimidine deaminase n=1 Tax=Actinorugispora endophytica TaxID=1605990 RepID=A0A4R6V6B3_9ACTN|nr:bifunctional diaminohydroxyphosphoribosylaminopyrimidine deaminase/5-amino-6-(5-phosphoribosylamino)uracil reductase RibD [Actinorugispora endophytica]TDQ54405.1 diaminohydroxyphosphoribosylaminopyrimidine deaminase [Actinorugispora endophytica]
MANPTEQAAMRRAIALSAHGLGTTSPNPPVGCLILDVTGKPVGEGYHHRKGEAHAEALALAQAGVRARGGTAIVTLEPCNHHGRTPPCRQALIDARIARVVISLIDPTSRGEGGAALLRTAGLDVEVGVLADETRLVLGPWMETLNTRHPNVWWAYTFGPNGVAASDFSRIRTHADAVIFADGRIAEAVPDSHGVGILNIPDRHDPADPFATLRALFDGGVRTVQLHGGYELAGPFLQRSLINQITARLTAEGHGKSDGKWEILPDGFAISGITREADAVIIEAALS